MPDAPLISFYGDDLTGSTDAMEALSLHGVPTVLFMQPPTEARRARFPGARAIGIAGTSRSQSPDWMEEHLARAFTALHAIGAEICHYKVCSTFDSSPTTGSIGRAMDIGARIFDQRTVPLLVGAPQLRRYTSFGHLFAAYRGEVFRIDRHPVMSRHPVTPMAEADLRLHLAGQTDRRVGLLDLASLVAPDAAARLEAVLADKPGAVLFDVADAATQAAAGAAIWQGRAKMGRFVVGSSGVEYALLKTWTDEGLVSGAASFAPPGPVARIAVVSGSCSPTTEAQIRHALDHGFDGIALDPEALIGNPLAEREAIARGLAVLKAGRSVILYTALGPETDRGGAIDQTPGGRDGIGQALGRILRALVGEEKLTRAVVAGGDTSSHAIHELDVVALETRLPLPQTPGSPLCTTFSETAAFDGLQLALKGGQVGRDDYFVGIRDGRG